MRGTDPLTATLAYRIACAQHPHTLTAAEAMKDQELCSQFEAVKVSMATWSVAFVEVDNSLELYLFEAYCTMELYTGFEAGDWNTFATHRGTRRGTRLPTDGRLVGGDGDVSSRRVCRRAAESRRQNVGSSADSGVPSASVHERKSPDAGKLLEAATGVEPVMEVLQTSLGGAHRCAAG